MTRTVTTTGNRFAHEVHTGYQHRSRHNVPLTVEDEGSPMRGLVIGLVLSLPFWVAVAWRFA